MMKSKMVSLYISWPTRVSQHCGEKEACTEPRGRRNKLQWGLAPQALITRDGSYQSCTGCCVGRRKRPHRVKKVIVATDAGVLFTFGDLGPEREEQNPNAGQAHEHAPVRTRGKERLSRGYINAVNAWSTLTSKNYNQRGFVCLILINLHLNVLCADV